MQQEETKGDLEGQARGTYLYLCDDENAWKQPERQSNGVKVVQVEPKKGADTRNNDLMSYLELARAGRIGQVPVGPPCRTVGSGA